MTELALFFIYASRANRGPECVCLARGRRHALWVANQFYKLPRTAYALPEAKS